MKLTETIDYLNEARGSKEGRKAYTSKSATTDDKKKSFKIAKGFTPGSATPSAKWASVKKHASRTLLRYGKGSDKLAQKYGSRTIKAERGIGGKDGREDKGDK